MKIIKYLFTLLAFSSILSCSKSSDSDPNAENPPVNDGYFNINYNNSPLVLPSFKVERDGDYFRVLATRSVTTGFSIFNDFSMLFHKDGTMIRSTMYDPSILNDFTTSFYFSEDTFTFNIESIDEINKKIKLNFTGKLYSHERNIIGAASKNINGSLFLPYTNISATTNSFAKNETTMLVNNVPWRGKGQTFNNSSSSLIVFELVGDSKYSLHLNVPLASSITLGTYNFSQNSDIYKVKTVNLLRYYPGEVSPNEFVCTGSLTISEKASGVIKGTFNLTAHDPLTNENVTVTNGVYSARY